MDPDINTEEMTELQENGIVSSDKQKKRATTLKNLVVILKANKGRLYLLFKSLLLLAYLSYVIYAFSVKFGDEGSIRLLVFTLVLVLFVLIRVVKNRGFSCKILQGSRHIGNIFKGEQCRRIFRWCINILSGGGVATYVLIHSLIDHPENLVSLAGITFFLLVMYVTSTNRKRVNWHTIYWGILLQLILGIIFIGTEAGGDTMRYISRRFEEFSTHADAGSALIFGPRYTDFPLVFQLMPRILFFVTAIHVLQYLGVISFFMRTFGSFLSYCLCTRPTESMVAASNTILALIESFVLAAPYLDSVSKSELFSLLVSGMATTAGDALLFFNSFGVPMTYLLTASVLSAPAALVCAKLNMPEEEDEEVNSVEDQQKENIGEDNNSPSDDTKTDSFGRPKNLLEAITKGGKLGADTISAAVVYVIIYMALADLIDTTIQWFGERVDIQNASFEKAIAYVLWPAAFFLGVPSSDCLVIGRMIGVRGFINTGVAYIKFGVFVQNGIRLESYRAVHNDSVILSNGDIFLPALNDTLRGGVLQERSVVIGSYALCGFSCLLVFGQILGLFAVIAPKRLNDVTKMIVRAFLISNIASFLTACIADGKAYA